MPRDQKLSVDRCVQRVPTCSSTHVTTRCVLPSRLPAHIPQAVEPDNIALSKKARSCRTSALNLSEHHSRKEPDGWCRPSPQDAHTANISRVIAWQPGAPALPPSARCPPRPGARGRRPWCLGTCMQQGSVVTLFAATLRTGSQLSVLVMSHPLLQCCNFMQPEGTCMPHELQRSPSMLSHCLHVCVCTRKTGV